MLAVLPGRVRRAGVCSRRSPAGARDQVTNGLCLRDIAGTELCLTGPGAGPDVTAVTILDDVLEAAAGEPAGRRTYAPPGLAVGTGERVVRPRDVGRSPAAGRRRRGPPGRARRLDGTHLRHRLARWRESRASLTYRCTRPQVERAVSALSAATRCTARVFRALEPLRMNAARSSAPGVAVIKIGGSVLTGPAAYERAASFIASRVADEAGARFVVVVSAEQGVTDALLELARGFSDPPDPAMRDLLWSTGELRSVALLALTLQARGVRATGVNVQQTGFSTDFSKMTRRPARPAARPSPPPARAARQP